MPDSFKGVATSMEAARYISEEIKAVFPDCEVIEIPIADGGEGSVEAALAAVGGDMRHASALSPDDRIVDAAYAIASNGSAIIEMAQSSGITRQNGLHPMTSSTYGFGQLIKEALRRGAGEFILCIGGSATTDGGCGMAAALGARFYDGHGLGFIPCGGTLAEISRIDMAGMDKRIAESRFSVMCDVESPLFGRDGAAYVFAPQKGASPIQVEKLDAGLRHLGAILDESFGRGLSDIRGAGAAGGLGAGCVGFLGATLVSGIDAMLSLCGFKELAGTADLIVTGEGKLDRQSFSGKVLSGILREAGSVPVISICGICECPGDVLRNHGLAVFEASEGTTAEESMKNPEKHIKKATRKAMGWIASAQVTIHAQCHLDKD